MRGTGIPIYWYLLILWYSVGNGNYLIGPIFKEKIAWVVRYPLKTLLFTDGVYQTSRYADLVSGLNYCTLEKLGEICL
jgi:hypothetical protein